MKSILSTILLLGVLAFTAPAQAQHAIDLAAVGGNYLNGGTNNVSFLTTNTSDAIVVTRGNNACIQVSVAADSGSTSNLVVRIDQSADGDSSNTHWMPSVWTYFLAGTSTTTNTHVTNIVVGATGYIRVNLANTNAAGRFTNIWVKVATKPGI